MPRRRGIAALPSWGLKNYVEHDYVVARRIGSSGLWSNLYASTLKETAGRSYLRDFLVTAKNTCFATLDGIIPLEREAPEIKESRIAYQI